MFQIDLRRLREGPIEIHGQLEPGSSIWEGSGIELAAPLEVEARSEAAAEDSVRVRGSLWGRLRGNCRRCLKPLELQISNRFEFFFDRRISRVEEDENLYALDPAAEELDLRVPLRERVVVIAPLYPVCGQDCRGLCVHCGANLNEVDCDCDVSESDPRWAPLMALREGSS